MFCLNLLPMQESNIARTAACLRAARVVVLALGLSLAGAASFTRHTMAALS